MKLYSEKILKLATEIPYTGQLEKAEKELSLRSPICGSKITIYINLKNGEISEYMQEVKACALGQASASIFGLNAIGQDYNTVSDLYYSVKNMLENNGTAPLKPFQKYELLRPAYEFKNRHASILLVLDAVKNALSQN